MKLMDEVVGKALLFFYFFFLQLSAVWQTPTEVRGMELGFGLVREEQEENKGVSWVS